MRRGLASFVFVMLRGENMNFKAQRSHYPQKSPLTDAPSLFLPSSRNDTKGGRRKG
jgi:hypothetical protein